jgi:hypothetical protein
MRFGERVVVFILRPIYRTFFERLFWWFLLKIKVFLLADVHAKLESIEARLAKDDSQQRLLGAMEERLRSVEQNNAAQWDSLEQLLLALFRQPHFRSSDSGWKSGTEREGSFSTSTSELNRTHAAGNLR